jgi:hypothetical protein
VRKEKLEALLNIKHKLVGTYGVCVEVNSISKINNMKMRGLAEIRH